MKAGAAIIDCKLKTIGCNRGVPCVDLHNTCPIHTIQHSADEVRRDFGLSRSLWIAPTNTMKPASTNITVGDSGNRMEKCRMKWKTHKSIQNSGEKLAALAVAQKNFSTTSSSVSQPFSPYIAIPAQQYVCLFRSVANFMQWNSSHMLNIMVAWSVHVRRLHCIRTSHIWWNKTCCTHSQLQRANRKYKLFSDFFSFRSINTSKALWKWSEYSGEARTSVRLQAQQHRRVWTGEQRAREVHSLLFGFN